MSAPASEASPTRPFERVLSVDLLRGLDVLLMLFVNEMAGVKGTPGFLLHKPHDADGMTVTDVVFPAFLFIIGMAIPLALGGRLRRGQSRSRVWRHVLVRTLALLVMGVFMVNAERDHSGTVLSGDLWTVLVTVGLILAWLAPAHEGGARRVQVLRTLGVGMLIVLAFLYRSEGLTGLIQMRPYWWGILGLIGWAYLAAAGAYLLAGERPAVLIGLVGLLYCVFLADTAGEASWLVVFRPILHVGSMLGSHSAVVLSGTVLTLMLLRHRQEGGSPGRLVGQALGYAGGLATAGFLIHTLHGLHRAFSISKVLATPAWCLLSSAATCVVWVIVFALVDLKGWSRWPNVVYLAGENALVAYLMAPFFLSLFALSAILFGGTNPYHALGGETWMGFVRSAVFAWGVVRVCGWMRSSGIRMQL